MTGCRLGCRALRGGNLRLFVLTLVRRYGPRPRRPGPSAAADRYPTRHSFPPTSGLGGVSKSSSRANRSAPYSRPAARFLKRAVDAVKNVAAAARTATHCQREADWARRSFTSSVAHSTPPPSQAPTTAQHSPPSARSLLVRAVPGLPRRYVAFPLPMVQGARCCVATSPGAYASRASATAALNVLSGSWLVL